MDITVFPLSLVSSFAEFIIIQSSSLRIIINRCINLWLQKNCASRNQNSTIQISIDRTIEWIYIYVVEYLSNIYQKWENKMAEFTIIMSYNDCCNNRLINQTIIATTIINIINYNCRRLQLQRWLLKIFKCQHMASTTT